MESTEQEPAEVTRADREAAIYHLLSLHRGLAGMLGGDWIRAFIDEGCEDASDELVALAQAFANYRVKFVHWKTVLDKPLAWSGPRGLEDEYHVRVGPYEAFVWMKAPTPSWLVRAGGGGPLENGDKKNPPKTIEEADAQVRKALRGLQRAGGLMP